MFLPRFGVRVCVLTKLELPFGLFTIFFGQLTHRPHTPSPNVSVRLCSHLPQSIYVFYFISECFVAHFMVLFLNERDV